MPAHIIISREEQIACPKCAHSFAISDGLSRRTIDRHAEAVAVLPAPALGQAA